MIRYVVYTPSGEILRTGFCQEKDLVHQATEPDTAVMEVFSECQDENHYISNGEVVPRPAFEITVTQSPFRIEGIPVGTRVQYPNGELIVDDGFIEWSSAVPGEFAFQLSCFPYRDEVIYATFA